MRNPQSPPPPPQPEPPPSQPPESPPEHEWPPLESPPEYAELVHHQADRPPSQEEDEDAPDEADGLLPGATFFLSADSSCAEAKRK